MLTYSIMLAVLGALDSLLTSLVADNLTHTQHDSDRELIGQGLGNCVSGLLGGLPGAGATMRTVISMCRLGGVPPYRALFTPSSWQPLCSKRAPSRLPFPTRYWRGF